MALTHTNRKGKTYYLHRRTDKKGRIRYVFAKTHGEGAIEDIPEGYEVFESIHGGVSLRKIKPGILTELEEKSLETILASHPHLQGCRMQQEGKEAVIYEPRNRSFEGGFLPSAMTAGLNSERYLKYDATMRFVLVDKTKRTFRVERMCYRSFIDGWMALDTGRLQSLAETYLPHLCSESFYELW